MAKFDDIKVGDQVIVKTGGYASGYSGNWYLATVERVTATQFVADGYRFTKRGWEVGRTGSYAARADVATPELIQRVEVEQRYRKAQDELRRKLDSVETLWREIDRNHDSYKWAATLEAALPHLTAAVEVLKNSSEQSL